MSSLYPKAIELADAIAAQETEDAQLIHDLTSELEATKAQLAVANSNVETQAATIRGLQAKIAELEAIIADLTADPEPEEPPVVVPPAASVFGPTGRHWARNTPARPLSTAGLPEVDCSWAAIQKAIAEAADGAIIAVKPGTLPGNGAGSTVKPVLTGGKDRATRVLLVPRDGRASIKFANSIRLDSIKGVTFSDFDLGDFGVVITGNSSNVGWARSDGRFFNLTASSAKIKTVDYIEVVMADLEVYDNDRSAWRLAGTGASITDVLVEGSYYAPTFNSIPVPGVPAAHTDTLQISGTGQVRGVVFRDTAAFASTNADFIVTSVTSSGSGTYDVVLDHVLLVGGAATLLRNPQPADAEGVNQPIAFNSQPDRLTIKNGSIVIGSLKPTNVTATGSYGNDPRLIPLKEPVTAAWLDRVAPKPTPAYLKQIWG